MFWNTQSAISQILNYNDPRGTTVNVNMQLLQVYIAAMWRLKLWLWYHTKYTLAVLKTAPYTLCPPSVNLFPSPHTCIPHMCIWQNIHKYEILLNSFKNRLLWKLRCNAEQGALTARCSTHLNKLCMCYW